MSEKKTKAKMSTSRLITLCMAVTFLLAGAIYMALQIVPISVVIKGDKFMYVEVFPITPNTVPLTALPMSL